jgi:protein-disulfide isomerase
MEPTNNIPAEQTVSAPAQPAFIQSLAIPFAIIVAGIAIAAAIYFGDNKAVVVTPGGNQAIVLDPVTAKDHILGNPKAKVTIIEYSDFECPFCKTFHETMAQVMNEYGESGKVAWVYRHFPLSFHSKADKEAQASECVGKLGGNEKFWQYANKIFAVTPSNNGLDLSLLPKMAKEIDIDETAFTACLESSKMKAITDAGLASGAKAGVRGTPHSLILVDKKIVGTIEGAQPFVAVKAQIDALLAK